MTPLITTFLIVVVIGGILTACAALIYIERKIAAFVQDRIGPNRVGPYGLLQSLADGLKFILKEDVIPSHVDKALFILAPAIAMLTTLFAFSVVPFGPTSTNPGEFQTVIAPGVDIGILFIFAVGSLAAYAVVLGGWASNNKYSLLGALRSSAQLISYEIPLGMSVLGVVLLAGSLNLEIIIEQQTAAWSNTCVALGLAPDGLLARAGTLLGWNIWVQPLAFLIFITSALAEANRLPFDLAECEQELVGGYHTEYSAMKFAMFFLAEYTHLVTVSFIVSILFLGGWHFPLIAEPTSAYFGSFLVKLGVLLTKVGGFILFVMLIRWTIPRFRFDQLMSLAWQVLLPLALGNLVCAMTVKQFGLSPWWLLPASFGLFLGAGAVGGWWKSPPSQGVAGRVSGVLPATSQKKVVWVEEPETTLSENLYLPAIFAGLRTTITHLFMPKVTWQFPEQRPQLPPNYRGVHRLNRDEQGRVKCVACFLCSTACPAHCIEIHAAASPWPDRDKYPEKFVIDELRCIYCGMCEEACPVDAIELTSIYDLTGASRQAMLYDREKLLSVFDQTVAAGTDPVRTGCGVLGPASEIAKK